MKDRAVRLNYLLKCLWMGMFALIAQAGAAPADAPVARLVLELSDGSRIIGTPVIDRFKMATDYANIKIPLSFLRTVELSGNNHIARVNFRNGDLLSGQLAGTDIALKTVFGQVTIPMSQVSRIRVGVVGNALPGGLVLYYTFDVDEGKRVTDMSNCGNHGKVQGAVYTSEGKAGGAMSFNGDRDMVIVGNPASLRLQDFTIMAWIKRASAVTKAGLFGYGHAGYILGVFPDGRLFLSKADFSDVDSHLGIHDGAYHHVAVTKQGNRVVFYVDGVADPAPDYDPDFEFNTDAAVGGREAESLSNSFVGVIDEVAVFNRGLSGDEVKEIYDSQK